MKIKSVRFFEPVSLFDKSPSGIVASEDVKVTLEDGFVKLLDVKKKKTVVVPMHNVICIDVTETKAAPKKEDDK